MPEKVSSLAEHSGNLNSLSFRNVGKGIEWVCLAEPLASVKSLFAKLAPEHKK